jgi:hypothetical protein
VDRFGFPTISTDLLPEWLRRLPFTAPLSVVTGALRLADRLAPDLPPIESPPDDEANLVVHMLVDAVPSYLGNPLVRTVVFAWPLPLAIGVRAEETAATVRIRRDRISLENGLADDALVIVDGGLDPLIDAAAESLSRELRTRLHDAR